MTLEVLVDEKGSVVSARAISGPDLLKTGAEKGVRRRRYRPGTRDGVPVRVLIQETIRFELPR